ncbi:helix-turn-helix domain-containing protein [Pseudoalteromonas sp. JC28]|nr:helix-turn-helix domain-containing protein [Pseudoalteromonas sp. JC28]
MAKRLNIARNSVNKWFSSYLEDGLDGLAYSRASI